MNRPLVALSVLTLSLASSACGGKQTEPEVASNVEVDNEDEFDDGMEMMQEFGGMNEEKVSRTFNRLAPNLAQCLTTEGQSRRYLYGDVAFLVKVNLEGQAVATLAEKSDLGSYAAERCMLDVLDNSRWPKPVGGYIGLARYSIGFDAPEDVRPPVQWTSNDVSETLALDENMDALSACGGGGPYRITAYVDTDGSVLSAGIAHSDDDGDATAACLVGAVEAMQFDSPGSWRAKVSFTR